LNPKQNSIQSLITGNPTAKRLEQIADFFNVTIDTFFIREGGIELSSTDSKNGLKSASAYVLQQEVKHRDDVIKFKDDMLREKDERIKLLEELLEVYRAQKSNAK
jgi:transcriptional regulator with XRE-family HTH domain